MKSAKRHILLPAILLGGFLSTTGCSTPTVTIGTPPQSDRFVLHVRSPIPTSVQCVWLQDGAGITHSGTTPFRLVFPASAVHKVTLLKASEAADVAIEIRPPGTEASRFVMTRGSSSMHLECQSRRWESRIF